MTPAPPPAVLSWLDRQETTDLYLSVITIAEIAYGIRALPGGARKQDLDRRFKEFVIEAFDQRLLEVTVQVAFGYAQIMGRRKEIGRPMSVPDGLIAATARAHRCAVATRNVKDFEHCGIEIVNPFLPE